MRPRRRGRARLTLTAMRSEPPPQAHRRLFERVCAPEEHVLRRISVASSLVLLLLVVPLDSPARAACPAPAPPVAPAPTFPLALAPCPALGLVACPMLLLLLPLLLLVLVLLQVLLLLTLLLPLLLSLISATM